MTDDCAPPGSAANAAVVRLLEDADHLGIVLTSADAVACAAELARLLRAQEKLNELDLAGWEPPSCP